MRFSLKFAKIFLVSFVMSLVGYKALAQPYVYTFEDAGSNSTTFVDHSYTFTINTISGGSFFVDVDLAGNSYGWDGSAADEKFIDNQGYAAANTPVDFTITGSGAFTVKSFWLYIADRFSNNLSSGLVTVKGYSGSTVVFTASQSGAWAASTATNNGFSLIDLSTFGSQNNSNVSITKLEIITANTINYVTFDAFKWAPAASSNTAPSFIGSNTLAVCQNAAATDVKGLLHVSDADASQTETWTQSSAPAHGTLTITSATASSGSTDITPGGTITYQPTAGYSGSDAFTIQVSDGTATATKTINVTVNPLPTITLGSNPSITNGTTTANLSYSATTGSPNQYSIAWNAGPIIAGFTNVSTTTLPASPIAITVPANPGAGTYTGTLTVKNSSTGCSSTGNTMGVVVTAPVNVVPAFVTGNSSTITLCNANANITDSVRVQDTDAGQTITWSVQLAPSHGTITVSGSGTATSGGTNIVMSDSIVFRPTAGYNGADSFSIKVDDGTASVIKKFKLTLGYANPGTITGNTFGCVTSFISHSASGGTAGGVWSSSNTAVATVNASNGLTALVTAGTTIISYTVTNGAGCTVSDTMMTRAFALSDTGRISGDSVLCVGAVTTMSSSTTTTGFPYTYAWSSSATAVATVNASTGVVRGLSAGTTRISYTISGCGLWRTFYTVNVYPSATITLGANPIINAGTPSTTLTYSGTVGNPDKYSIVWDAAAHTAGFTDVPLTSLPASPITITIPPGAVAGSYAGTLTPVKSTSTCSGTGSPMSVTLLSLNAAPIYTLSSPQSLTVCKNASATDIKGLLHVSDADAAQTLTWTQQSAPANGTLTITGATASSGSMNITPGGTITYQPTAEYSGTDAFTIRVSDGTATADMVVNVNVTAVSSSVSSLTNVACNGGSNGAATVSATGGTPGYTYSWAPSGGSLATATGLTAGTYTCTIADANSCAKTQTVTITQPTAITATTSSTNVSCNGGSNGTAGVSATGGTGTLTYAWAPAGGTSATATGLVAGSYTCTITDANTCSITKTVAVTQPTAITATTSSTSVSCNGGSNGTAGVSATGGTGTLTYSWAPAGGTSATATGLVAGSYTCTITDANTCSITKTVTVTQPTAITATTSSTNVSCNGGSNGTAGVSATGGTGTLTYSWAPAGGTSATATGLTAGSYTCTITDANTCSIIKTFTITQPTVITSSVSSQTNVACNGAATGAATVSASGGAGGYTYSWAPSGGSLATATGLTAGSYTCTITDANSCIKTQVVTLTQPAGMTSSVASQTNVACNGGSNGAATVSVSGGATPYTYSWSPAGGNTATATGLAAGTYTCTITDDNTCTKAQIVTITQPTNITSSISSQTNVSCNGGSNGAATVSANGGTPGYTYVWSPIGGTAATATGLAAGTYTCTITDANSCSHTQVATITQPVTLSASASQVAVTCNGGSNGRAIASVSGGTTPYTYSWSPAGGTSSTATGLTVGDYTVTVIDNNSCQTTASVTVTQPAALAATATVTATSCNGGSNGTATASVSGGVTPYSYSWSPAGGTGGLATGLSAGTYTVSVEDNNGCTTTATATVGQPSAITASTSFTAVSCNGGSNGTASVSASGGTGTLSYSWAPAGGTAATATGLTARTYTVTITDDNSCSITKTATVTQPTAIVASTTKTDISCHGNNDGTATVTASGGTGTLDYSWAPAGGTSATATALAGGTYTVTITDDNSCELTKTATIVEPATLTANINTSVNVSCNGGNNGSATVTVGGGTLPYTYSWAPAGGTLATGTGLSAGDYTVTVTDAHSCTATASVTITEPHLVTASIAGTTTVCNNTGSSIYLSSEAGVSVAYTINGGSTQNAIMDANGADTIATGNLTAPASYDLVSVTVGGCTYPATGNVTVSVYPQATVNSISNQTVCNTANTNSVVFDGPVTGTTFTWTNNNTSIGLASSGADSIGAFEAVNTGTTAQTATVTVTPTANGCVGATRTFTIKVNPTPAITGLPTDQAVCNDNNTTTLSFSANVSGTTYTWTNSNSSIGLATSGTGSKILPFTATNTTTDPVTATIAVTPKANSCVGATESFSVTVNPTPQLNSGLTIAAICDSSTAVYTPASATAGTAFVWDRAAVAGISNAAGNGNDGINETLYNTTVNPVTVTYVYTLTANSCSNMQNVTVSVKPTPVLTSTLTPAAICNNATFSYAPTSATTGTTFQWSRAAVSGIDNAANSGNDNPNEALTNTTADPVSVTYVYTLTANSCTHIQNVTVTVYPTPVLTTTLTPSAICDNGIFNYVPASATTGTTFTWSRATVAGISNAANTGNDDPNEALHNTTTDPVAVTYVYTLTANSCSNTQNVTVTVNPTPVLSSTLTATPVCNNTVFSYVPTSATTGTAFAWSRATVTGISNAANTGNDDPNETLVNITADPVTVTYVYTLTANSCTNTQNVTVVVYPTPMLTSTLTPSAICDGNTFSYVPTSATTGTAFTWSRAAVAGISNTAANGNNNPNEVLNNTTADPVTVTYVYTLTANGCTNTQDVTVTVNPTPVLSSTKTPATICDSTVFNYVPTSATAGTTFAWERIADESFYNATANGTDNPAETLYLSGPVGQNAYYVYTLTANGCIDTEHLAVPVQPVPSLTSTLSAPAVCNNTTFSYTATSATPATIFEWSRAAVTGISNTANNGTGNISETLDNTTTDPIEVTYIYTLTAGGCSRTQPVRVTVNPTPVLTTTLTPSAICDNGTFNYVPASATVGTTFAWSRATVAGISNAANTGNDDPNEALHNTTTDPVAVTYVYTLTANSCSNTQNVTVTVNPTPVLSSTLTATPVCNNTLFSYTPTSATTGTTFQWSRATVTGISNTANAGNDDPNETLVNITADPVTVTYVYTLTANSCTHTQHVTVVVYPTPMLTSTLTPSAICNNTTFSYTPTSGTTGTTYQWSRAVVTGISNTANNGTDDPEEALHNTTANPVAVTYVYTLTANGCTNTQDVTVTVNPTPVLSSTLTAAPICNNTVFNYVPTSATSGTAFSWSRATVTGISNAANTGNDDPAETLSNTTVDPIVVTYVYTLTANGCTNTQSVDVTVNPTPVLTTTLTASPVCDSSLFSYDPASATAGTTYQWSRATVTGISNAATTGTDNPMEYLVNTTPDPVNVQYVYTLTANSCTNTQSVTVTVYPKPLLSTTLTPAAICDSTTFAYTPNSLTTGTTYVWSRDVVAGISNPANADNTDPAEVLDNTTVNPVAVTYVYTLTANGCTNTQNVIVTVNPTPVLTSTLTVAPICDSTLFSYVPTSATTGTTFAWSRDTMDNIINPSATGTDNPMEYLVNIAPYPVNVAYTYTLTANGCSHTETVQMTVNPKPLLSSTLAPVSICDSATFSYVPTSLTSGTTYSWSRAAVTGIANTAGTGTDNPMEVLYNTTADSVAVEYVYTLTAYGCGNTQNVQVYVKPTPKLSSTLSPAAICNSTVFNYTPTSATGGTAFTWTRAVVSGISNPAGSGTDNPMETLTNTLVNPVNVPYVFSMAAAGCTHSEVVTVRVNPTPKLSSSMTGEVCSTAPFTYSPTSATTGSSYAWTRTTAPGISNAAGSGTGSVNEVLINQTNLAKTVTYRYTITANGCSNIQNVVVTVDPTPVIPVIAIHPDATLCSKSQYMNFGASIAAADSTNYNWTAQNAVVYAEGAGHTNAIVSFPNSGTANVILTAGINGYTCYTRDTFTVAVSTSEAPNAEVYYIHDHFIYTDNTVSTYQWGYDDAATLDSVMFTGQVDQNYYDAAPDFTNKKYWVITTKDGCLSKSYYNAPTGVVNVNSAVAVNLTVVPNPASNYVTVGIDGVSGSNDKVELTDLTGKTVLTEAVHNNTAQLNVNNLASGVYVVTYYHNGVKAGTAKLVKE